MKLLTKIKVARENLMSLKEKIYKVSFINQGKVYDIFAKGVHQSGLLGFIEVEEIVFGERARWLLTHQRNPLNRNSQISRNVHSNAFNCTDR